MKEVNVEFENCYGIKKLSYKFDFTKKSTIAIYAPNGVMKTSFAKTFMDFSKGESSKDLVFGHLKTTKRSIKNESEAELDNKEVFVIEPYNEQYRSKKISTLLANKELKEEYERVLGVIEEKKLHLLKEITTLAGITGKNARNRERVEADFASDFRRPEDFFKALMRVQYDVSDNEPEKFTNIHYYEIFNDKVLDFLKDNQEELDDYTKRYEELIQSSRYFKKGVFSHNNAVDIAKSLKDNGFFKANHTVVFNQSSVEAKTEFKNIEDLEYAIQEEMNSIMGDSTLLSTFQAIDNKLNRNKELRKFRDYLMNNLSILPELKDLGVFKENIWISYLKRHRELFDDLVQEYNQGKEQIEDILEEARKGISNWVDVINIFNQRFFVPFKITIENQESVILKSDIPNFKFYFKDEGSQYPSEVAEDKLLKALSNGEKRALYILNIVFEVEARKRADQETLFIVDDIADSFDYRNKYAIIEYLQDIASEEKFKQIVLSHNFDFYRSISGRLGLPRAHKLHAQRAGIGVKLVQEQYQNNPFMHWKTMLSKNNIMLVASIPFVRNLAEYSGNEDVFQKITSLLHIKQGTFEICIKDLEDMYKQVLVSDKVPELPNPDDKVINVLYQCANQVLHNGQDNMSLENKVVLSLAIRLKAEEYMLDSIEDEEFVRSITKNQTFQLFSKFRDTFPRRGEAINILDQVNLMTPENIHINSFMYEPILDMSDLYLKELYNKVTNL